MYNSVNGVSVCHMRQRVAGCDRRFHVFLQYMCMRRVNPFVVLLLCLDNVEAKLLVELQSIVIVDLNVAVDGNKCTQGSHRKFSPEGTLPK